MNPIKILVTNQKGGVGKSTIAANLAGYFNIRKNHSISLIDFDRQASSTVTCRRIAKGSIQIHHAGMSYLQNAGLTMLDAKSRLRNLSKNVDIVISDLTWTHGISYDFLKEFDLIVVPSSTSRVEIASTKIFILEYIESIGLKKYKENGQSILVVPNRIELNEEFEAGFDGLKFLTNCFIAPPIYRVSEINRHLETCYFFDSEVQSIQANFCQFGEYVYDKAMRWEGNLAGECSRPSNHPIEKLQSPTSIGNSQAGANVELDADSSKDEAIPRINEESFFKLIPAFLRKK